MSSFKRQIETPLSRAGQEGGSHFAYIQYHPDTSARSCDQLIHRDDINHGRYRTTHNATTGASDQHTHHTRTSAAHGRSPSKSQSTTLPTPTTTIPPLNTLTKCLNYTANRRAEAASTHRSPIHSPRCPRLKQQQQRPRGIQGHRHSSGAQVPEIRRVRLQQNDRHQRRLHDAGG